MKVKAVREVSEKCEWTDENRFILIQVLTDNPSDADIGLKKSQWIKIVREFNEMTGLAYNNSHLQSQFNTLKQKFQIFANYEGNSGFGFHAKTRCVTGPESALDLYCSAHPKASQFRRNPFPFYEVLKVLLLGSSEKCCNSKIVSDTN